MGRAEKSVMLGGDEVESSFSYWPMCTHVVLRSSGGLVIQTQCTSC